MSASVFESLDSRRTAVRMSRADTVNTAVPQMPGYGVASKEANVVNVPEYVSGSASPGTVGERDGSGVGDIDGTNSDGGDVGAGVDGASEGAREASTSKRSAQRNLAPEPVVAPGVS